MPTTTSRETKSLQRKDFDEVNKLERELSRMALWKAQVLGGKVPVNEGTHE